MSLGAEGSGTGILPTLPPMLQKRAAMGIAFPARAFRLLEHVAFALLAAGALRRLLTKRAKKSSSSRAGELKEQAAQYLEALRLLTQNVASKTVFTWPEVQAAPPPSMDVSALQPGQSTAYHDDRGSIYRFKIAEGVLVNMYFTRAGVRRSGDLHDCTQYDVVMKGRTRLRMLDPETGVEIVSEYAENDFIVIPARTPHMFEFLEDNCLLEWWSEEFKAWYYKPYRSIIDQGLPLADTQNRDFSIQA